MEEAVNLSGVALTHYRLKDGQQRSVSLSGADGAGLTAPNAVGSGVGRDPLTLKLSEVIEQMNDLFQGDLTEADFMGYVYHIRDKLLENDVLQNQARHNTREQFALGDFQKEMKKTVATSLESYNSMAGQVFSSERVQKGLADILLKLVYDSFKGREGRE